MYFTGTSLETAKELEQVLGKYQFEDENKRTVIRSLMTNDEIRTMKTNKAILVCGHHPPIMARLRPFYKNHQYLKNSQIDPPVLNEQQLGYIVPLLLLKATNQAHVEEEKA